MGYRNTHFIILRNVTVYSYNVALHHQLRKKIQTYLKIILFIDKNEINRTYIYISKSRQYRPLFNSLDKANIQ